MSRGNTTRVEALKWLKQGGTIHFSDDPLVASSELLVEGLYEQGAERVEMLLYPTYPEDADVESRTLMITLSDDYDTMLSAMFEIGILTPSGPITREQEKKNTVGVLWEEDRERLPDSVHVGVEKGKYIYEIRRVLLPKSYTTFSDGTVVDFGGTLDNSVIKLLRESGALVDPIKSDEGSAIGIDVVLPESYDKALECMMIVALLGLDVGSTIISESAQCTRVHVYPPDNLLE